MKRKCQIIRKSANGRKAICIDTEAAQGILDYIDQDKRHQKKFRHIAELILRGLRNPELYDKEEPNSKCKGVFAMKFFKGQENDRIYCKEQSTESGLFIIVTAELYLKKKTQKLSQGQISIIEKIASYEYEIEK